MADFGIAEIAALAGLLSAGAGAGTSIAGAVRSANQPKPSMPTVAPQQDTTQISRALLPGVKADAAARSGGGLSPEFLANLVTNATGEPGAGLDILSDIKKSLGPGI